jgi:hypothetical protein
VKAATKKRIAWGVTALVIANEIRGVLVVLAIGPQLIKAML